MDQTEGWNAQSLETEDTAKSKKGIGEKLLACSWTYTKAVICNVRKDTAKFKDEITNPVVEVLHVACSRVVYDHQWVSEFSLLMHGHDVLQKPNYDIDVPCIAQWALVVVHCRMWPWNRLSKFRCQRPSFQDFFVECSRTGFCVESNKGLAAEMAG